MRHSLLVVPFLSLLALACSGSVIEDTSGDGDGDSSVGDGDSGDGDSGDGDNGDGDGDSGDGDGDGDLGIVDVCGDLRNETGDAVIVEIVNEKATPIYLGAQQQTCGNPPLFSVSQGTELFSLGSSDGCGGTCQDMIDFGGVGCDAACFIPSTYQLDPGASMQTEWRGVVYQQTTFINSCSEWFGPEDVEYECSQAVVPADGTYTFSAVAGTAPNCDGFLDVECTPCVAVAGEACVVENSSTIGGELLDAATQYVVSGGSSGASDAPADPAGEPAGPLPPVEPDIVRIVFSD